MTTESGREGLSLELAPAETLLINGVTIIFTERTKLLITTPSARVLHGKMVMSKEVATTPARELYLLLQNAYMQSTDEGRIVAVAQLDEVAAPQDLRVAWNDALNHISNNRWYPALKRIYRMFEKK
mgnify:CR=1 FL=1